MPQISRRETKKNLRAMARAQVDMERGTYVWPDGRAPVDANGTPIVEKNELIRVGGYSTTAASHGRKWFEDPYFERHVQLERDRRDGKLPVVAKREQVDGRRVLKLGKKMLDETERRLAETPEKFTNSQLLQYTTMYLKFGLELLAKTEDDDQRKTPPGRQFNTLLGDIVVNMDENELAHLKKTTEKSAVERMQAIQSMIDTQLNAKESADDGDAGLVVDAQVSPE